VTGDEPAAVQVTNGPRGRVVTLWGPWSVETEAALADPDAIRLNVMPWNGPPLDLEVLAGVEIAEIGIGDRRITDLEPLAHVRGALERVTFVLGPDAIVDMSWFPFLRELTVDWQLIEGWGSRSETLESLNLPGFDGADLTPLGENPCVRALRLDQSRLESVDGVDLFPAIDSFWIGGGPRVLSIAALQIAADTLTRVNLDTCTKLGRLDAVAGLERLEVLQFGDCRTIESLSPVAELTNLRVLHAWGSTRIGDLDLAPLTRLPLLRELRMQSRRGYTPAVAEVQSHLAAQN
jgi:internalin A